MDITRASLRQFKLFCSNWLASAHSLECCLFCSLLALKQLFVHVVNSSKLCAGNILPHNDLFHILYLYLRDKGSHQRYHSLPDEVTYCAQIKTPGRCVWCFHIFHEHGMSSSQYIVRVSQCVFFYVSCLPSLSAKWRRQAWIQRRHHMVTSGAFLHLAYEIPPPSCAFRPALARWPKYRQRHFGIVIVLHRIRDICFKCSLCWKDEPSSSSESSTSSEDCPHTGATRVLRCWYHFCSLITAQKQL